MNRSLMVFGFFLGFLLGLVALQTSRSVDFALVPTTTMGEHAVIKSLSTAITTTSERYLPPISVIKDGKAPYRILCWMPVLNVTTKIALIVSETWGRYCDRFYFVAQDGDLKDQVIAHHYAPMDRHDLWNQVHRGWTRIAEMHLNDFDWFVKLDSDSFFVANNFRYWVEHRKWDPNTVLYFGHTMFEQSRSINLTRAQFNAGAGYGVSRRLLQLMYPYFPTTRSSFVPVRKRCPEWHRWGEDVKFADCLRVAFPTLLPNNTRDDLGKETFLPFNPTLHIGSTLPSWYYRGKDPVITAKQQLPLGCCSDRPVLWHKCRYSIFWLDYFYYRVVSDPRPPDDFPLKIFARNASVV